MDPALAPENYEVPTGAAAETKAAALERYRMLGWEQRAVEAFLGRYGLVTTWPNDRG